MSEYLTPPAGLRARLWFALRANPRFRYKALAVLGAALAALSYGAGIFGQREIRARIAATSITPITSLTAGLTGALYVSADRIDLWARTTSGSATLNLVEYNADDGKWAKVGADCSVDTNLTQCRYVAKRGSRYWHVYKASGTMAYVGLEALVLPVGQALGSIEAGGAAGTVTSVAMSVPAALLSVSGSPITSSGTFAVSLASQSANRIFAGPSSGGSTTPTFRALVPADLASGSSDGTYLTVQSGALAWGSLSVGNLGWYGDGSDGDVTVSGGTTTLSREMVYNSLVVTGTGVLDMNGWPVRVLTTLTVQSGGRVRCDGYAASGSTGAPARIDNYLGGSTAGSNGSNTNASGASNITNSAGGGTGGTGGSGNGGANFGGSGGTRSLLAAGYGAYRAFPLAIQQYAYNGATLGTALLRGGTGGGGGAGSGVAPGGGGGSGGGRAVIIAYAVSNSGTISANGGAGAAATNANSGGGGGGGGGSITVAYRTYTGNDPTASGGAGGAGNGNGTAGSAGGEGLVLKLQL